MSAISPIQYISPLSPSLSHPLKRLYHSIKAIEILPLSTCRTVSLKLAPMKMSNSDYSSVQCYIRKPSNQSNHSSPVLYKVTSISNFIDFIYALSSMKSDEVSHVVALDLSFFTYHPVPPGFENLYKLLQQKCPYLREIIWNDNLPIDENFFSFLKGFQYLTRLNLSHCSQQIKDEHLKELIKSTPQLTNLDIAGCDYITDKGISYLSSLLSLERLNLAYLDKITDDCFFALSELKQLKFIDLFNTNISDDFIYDLKISKRDNGLKIQFDYETVLSDSYDDVFGW